MFRSGHSIQLCRELIEKFNVCTESELLKVKVSMIFFGAVGFSAPNDGR